GLVMLIAAANVLNLFLVRAEARQQELAVRAALGAGRARMARSLMLESGLVAAASLGVGWLLAALALGWLRAQGPGNLPRLEDMALGWPSLLLGAGLALGMAIMAGLAPVARGRIHLAAVLGGEGHGAGSSRGRRRTRNLLATAQMALALVLLVAAGLMLRSLAALRGVDSGMADPATLQYFRLSMPGHLDAGAIMRKQQSILERLAAIPGVRSAGLADQLPMQYSADWDIVVRRGDTFTAQSSPPAREFTFISPGFLGTAGIRLEAGRDFSWNDIYAKRPYVVISAGLARDFWGNPQSALGKELSASGPGQWNQVIGVAADVRSDGVGKPAPETVYWPALGANLWGSGVFAQNPVTVVLRTPRAGSAALLTSMQQAVSRVDPDLPIYTVGTLQGLEAGKLARQTFTMAMLTLAGGMALALGLVGLYGVIAYDVERRRREVGIRMALGADRGSVLWMFVRQGLKLAVVGGAAGLVAAALATQGLRTMLFGVAPLDAITFAGAAALLLLTVAAASYFPARRASGVDAARVLRQ
ncbi:MAG: FtsX-like permease family protein, partial [Terriglobales bacterium]